MFRTKVYLTMLVVFVLSFTSSVYTASSGGVFPVKNLPAQEVSGISPQTTLFFKSIDGIPVAFQNGIPVPTFEPQKRHTLFLNGEWRAQRFDADHNLSMMPRTVSSVKFLEEQAKGRTKTNFNDSEWEVRCLPLPENTLMGLETANSTETYENGVWYRRSFKLDDSWKGQTITLKSLAMNYIADIWVNGSWVGFHEGGFTPFALDLTPFVKYGKANSIVIRIDNPPWGSRDDIIPAVEGTDFFNYTGVIQDLYLEGTSQLLIARADVIPLDTSGHLKVRIVIENRSRNQATAQLKGVLYEADTESPMYLKSPNAADIKGSTVTLKTPINASITIPPNTSRPLVIDANMVSSKLWSLGNPNLYIGEFSLETQNKVVDIIATQFGVRTVEAEKATIRLNGRSTFFAGIARHEEWPDYGRTASWSRIVSDLKQIKDTNANLVRTGHYPNHVYTYIALDRLGLAAMSEIPLWQFEKRHFEAQAERRFADQMWREMVLSQYNRPSVLMWSTQNESKDVMLRKAYNERLVHDLRSNYNDGRLITQSAAADQPGYSDASVEPLDVAGWTMYFGVFHGGTPYEGTKRFLERAHERWPDKPIINTEFGYWSREDDGEGIKQLDIYKATFKALTEVATVFSDGRNNPNGYLAGIDFWIMYNWYVNHNKWIDTFGIYHMDRSTSKPVTEIIKSDYRKMLGSHNGIGR